MRKPILHYEKEFDMMVSYQIAIESNSVIMENSISDRYRYSLYEVIEPHPSYEEYLNGHEFDEGLLLMNSSILEDLKIYQEMRRKENCTMSVA